MLRKNSSFGNVIEEDLSIVFFFGFTVFNLGEMSGFYSSIIRSLDYPFFIIIPIVMVFFGTFGLLGILTGSKEILLICLAASGIYMVTLLGLLILIPEFSLIIMITTLISLGLAAGSLIIGVMVFVQSKPIDPDLKKLIKIKKSDNLALEISELKKYYQLSEEVTVRALDGINLEIERGDFIAIMGPSGSGKSTLLNCIGALDRPTSGDIKIDGINLADLDEDGLAWLRSKKIGFIFQAYNLINRIKVGENVQLPAFVTSLDLETRRRKAESLLSSVGLEQTYDRHPTSLSGGEQQRVAIARALMNDPTFLLADEPTGNLDSKSGAVVMGILEKLNRELGVTLIVVTHDPEVGNLAKRIYYLKDGKNVGVKELI
ncbi:MAG: ABC transporter ATP-binding protein [Candidatus Heimdallarchaeota archaeon]